MKRYLCFIIALCLLIPILSDFTVHAQEETSVRLQTVQYKNGSYVAVDSVNPADRVILQVQFDTPVQQAGGVSLTIDYDSSLLSYVNDSASVYIVDPEGNFVSHAVAAAGSGSAHINLIWDTVSSDITISGLTFSVSFDVVGNDTATVTNLSATVKSLFQSDKEQSNITITAVKGCALTIGNLDMSAFRALHDNEIRYDKETLDRIVAAERVFAAFTNAQAKAFKSGYPELYQTFSTARATYNRLAQQATKDQILREAQRFIEDFADLWEVSPEADDILEYKERVDLANTTYNALSDQAKQRIATTYTDQLKKLAEAIEQRGYDIADAKEFKEGEFALLWNLDDATVKETYKELFTTVDGARIAYDGLSEYAKGLVAEEAAKLTHIEELIKKCMQDDEKTAALQKKTNAFMQKWSQVFALNVTSVKREDKSAIEMAIKDSKTLEEDVQKALESRIRSLEKLLKVIEGYDSATDSTSQAGGGVQTIRVPGETVTNTIIQRVTEKVQGETQVVSRWLSTSLNRLILYLTFIILFGMVIMIIPILLLNSVNRSLKKYNDNISGGGRRE